MRRPSGMTIAGIWAVALLPASATAAERPRDGPVLSPGRTPTVLGRDATALITLFGRPDVDLSEGIGRKLQFAGPVCVLDAYLYARGGGDVARVTHVDTRRRDGGPIDPASCIAALSRRGRGF